MKCSLVLLLLGVLCLGAFGDARQDEFRNGPLLDRLVRSRRQSGGVNYGFPTFPDFTKQGQFAQFGQQGHGGGLSLVVTFPILCQTLHSSRATKDGQQEAVYTMRKEKQSA
ncbi:uncharacterized protein LOC121603181 [Anopheles merus]|uniref:uncharacterized protein LOC121603181 n=1 Tax=Anopheles merus TaxID=30066 RepID=UPI001BE499B8|nr:uncharacterized protein LOC121603181 [Anopheles merus]